MIKKKFEKIEDGINNMLDAAAHDYKRWVQHIELVMNFVLNL